MHNDLPVIGYRIDNFCYLTDVKTIIDLEKEKLKEIDVLVLSCLRIEPHPNHLNLDEALKLIESLMPKSCYLTHISHLLGFHDDVEKKLPNEVHLSYDGLVINL